MNRYGHCYRCGSAYQRFEDPYGMVLLMPTCECAGDPPVDHSGDDWLIYLGNVHRLHYTPEVQERSPFDLLKPVEGPGS